MNIIYLKWNTIGRVDHSSLWSFSVSSWRKLCARSRQFWLDCSFAESILDSTFVTIFPRVSLAPKFFRFRMFLSSVNSGQCKRGKTLFTSPDLIGLLELKPGYVVKAQENCTLWTFHVRYVSKSPTFATTDVIRYTFIRKVFFGQTNFIRVRYLCASTWIHEKNTIFYNISTVYFSRKYPCAYKRSV